MNPAREFWTIMDRRFCALDRVRTELPDWRAAWRSDRRALVLLVELHRDDAVAELASRIGVGLRSIGVPPVARDGLHITICEFGFVDELSSDVETVARECGRAVADVPAFSVGITGASSFPTAAVLRVEPWDRLCELRRRLIDGVEALAAARAHRDRPPAEGGFVPHCTIAYYSDEVRTADVSRALAPFGDVAVPTVEVRDVALVSVRPPADAWFTWDVVTRFTLARATASGVRSDGPDEGRHG